MARFECAEGHVNYVDSSEVESTSDGGMKYTFHDPDGCWCGKRYVTRASYLCESTHEKAEILMAYEEYLSTAKKLNAAPPGIKMIGNPKPKPADPRGRWNP